MRSSFLLELKNSMSASHIGLVPSVIIMTRHDADTGLAGPTVRTELRVQLGLVNGAIGVLSRLPDGRPFAVLGFTISDGKGKIVEIDILADAARLSRLDLAAIDGDAPEKERS